ncbi:unnamed protein product, partial [Adineta ricciae]
SEARGDVTNELTTAKREQHETVANEGNHDVDLSNTELTNDQKERLEELLKAYPDVFTDKPGKTTKLKHEIHG